MKNLAKNFRQLRGKNNNVMIVNDQVNYFNHNENCKILHYFFFPIATVGKFVMQTTKNFTSSEIIMKLLILQCVINFINF